MHKNFIIVKCVAKDPVKNCRIMKDPNNEKHYFVKKIKSEGDDVKISGLREMCFSLTMNNSHLVKLYEVEEYQSKLIFIYDYYPNGNLRDEIKNRSSEIPKRHWQGEQLLIIWKELIEGLKILEDFQCAHRDIRPENIIKCSEVDYKITNFQQIYDYWNREEHDLKNPFQPTFLNAYVGRTINYRKDNHYYSPEILNHFLGNSLGFNPLKSDVYSLGLVFLHMASLTSTSKSSNLKLSTEDIVRKIQGLNYTDFIKDILGRMLIADFNQRPSFNGLYRSLLCNYQEIKITSINEKIKKQRINPNEDDFRHKTSAPRYNSINSYKNKLENEEKIIEDCSKNNDFQKSQNFVLKKHEISNFEANSNIFCEKEKSVILDYTKKDSIINSKCKFQSPWNSKKQTSLLLPGKMVPGVFSPILSKPVIKEENKVNQVILPEPVKNHKNLPIFSMPKPKIEIKTGLIVNKNENLNIFLENPNKKEKSAKKEEDKLGPVTGEEEQKNKSCKNFMKKDVQIYEEIIGNANTDPSWNCQIKKCKILESNTMAAAKIYRITEKTTSIFTYERDLMEKFSSKPSFLKYYGSFIDQDSFYIISEYIPRSLQDFINDRSANPLNEDESMNFTVLLLKGLKSLEKTKICHCDIKPENILLTEDKKPKIIDFSSSRAYDENFEGEIEIRGTVRYLAPEIIKEGRKKKRTTVAYDMKRADAFSLGVTLIETYLKKATNGLGLEANKRDLEENIKRIPWEWAQNIVNKLIYDRLCMEDTYIMLEMHDPGTIRTLH